MQKQKTTWWLWRPSHFFMGKQEVVGWVNPYQVNPVVSRVTTRQVRSSVSPDLSGERKLEL